MDGDGPCQADGELDIGTDFFLFYLLLFLVEGVAHIGPAGSLHFVFMSFLGDYPDDAFFLVDGFHDAKRAVYPAVVHVVFDENDMGSRLDVEFLGGGEATLGEIIRDGAFKHGGLTGK